MTITKLAGLMKIELRDGRTIRLCDGAFVWADIGDGPELFLSSDPVFGVIGSMESINEAIGDQIPAFEMTFLPNSLASAAELSAPGMQRSIVRAWVAELSMSTDLLVKSPDLIFHGELDQTKLRTGRGKRELDMSFVSTSSRLLSRNEGNSLSSVFHKSVFPGELGEDNATGLGVTVAWGVEAAAPSVSYNYGYGGGLSYSGSANSYV